MKLWRPKAVLPLLSKELFEQGARRRTYILRTVYAFILFCAFCIFFYDELSSRDTLAILGSGRELFGFVVYAQFVGIFVMLPGMMSGVLTSEKERSSLSLLLVTDLRPSEIILQKYFARLIPMFAFILLSLPLLGVCYAMGGLTGANLGNAALQLFLCCLQVGAVAIVVSAYCATTTSAFIGAYLMTAVAYTFGTLCCFPAATFTITESKPFWATFIMSIPTIAIVLGLLALARSLLLKRAFARQSSFLMKTFKRQDRFWKSLNRRIGGIVLVKDGPALPKNDPVAWRELTKKPIGKASYLVRLAMMINVPLWLLGLFMMATTTSLYSHENVPLSVMVCIGAALSALVVSVVAAGSVPAERSDQTLDVLLSTPINGREIILQKMRPVRRLILLCLGSLLVVIAMEGWSEGDLTWRGLMQGRVHLEDFLFPAISACTLAVCLTMFAWIAFWIGLKSRTRVRAVITTLLVMVLWTAVPLVALVFATRFVSYTSWWAMRESFGYLSYLFLLGPGTMLVLSEFQTACPHVFGVTPWLLAVLNTVFYGTILLLVRRRCLRKADAYLGRVGPETGGPILTEAPEDV